MSRLSPPSLRPVPCYVIFGYLFLGPHKPNCADPCISVRECLHLLLGSIIHGLLIDIPIWVGWTWWFRYLLVGHVSVLSPIMDCAPCTSNFPRLKGLGSPDQAESCSGLTTSQPAGQTAMVTMHCTRQRYMVHLPVNIGIVSPVWSNMVCWEIPQLLQVCTVRDLSRSDLPFRSINDCVFHQKI